MYLFIFTIMSESKGFKSKITDYIVTSIKKINFLNLSDKDLGFFIRAYHVNLPMYLLIFMFYVSKVKCILIIIYLFIALFLFIFFNGCILSKIENNLDGEDITIIDPALSLFRLEKNNKNRMYASYIIGTLYLS